MNRRRGIVVATAALGMVFVAQFAQASAISFTEDFSGLSLPTNLEEPLVSGGTDFSGGNSSKKMPLKNIKPKIKSL